MTAPRHLKVFLSSPADVGEERQLAHDLLLRLDTTPLLRGRITIEVVSWDDANSPAPMDASITPQEAVNRHLPTPSDCDITICILWGRMGTPLDEPRRPDGSSYLSGTHWEFEHARAAGRTVLLYRRTTPVTAVVTDDDFAEKKQQALLVQQFFDGLRGEQGTYLAGYTQYESPAAFVDRLRKDLEGVVRSLLSTSSGDPEPPPTAAAPDLRSLLSDGVLLGSPTVGHDVPTKRHDPESVVASKRMLREQRPSERMGAVARLLRWLNGLRPPSGSSHATPRSQSAHGWTATAQDAGFRGLLSYGPMDILPGHHRRIQARAIVRDVLHHDFRFGVVAGGVGSGKTSLLASGILPLANAGGVFVLLIRSPRRFTQEIREESLAAGTVPIVDLIAALSRRCEQVAAHGQLLLVIDQFEELLLDYQDRDDRQRLGAFLDQPTGAQSTKVLCGVREDYLVHLRSLAPALPNPISTQTLFHVENLSVNDAAEIIRECAEREKESVPPELAGTIAADLAQSGLVRPAELQIVCTALRDRLTVRGYEAAGGARDILAHHIQQTLDLSADSRLARALVRGLIDFDTIPPSRRAPQLVLEVVERAGREGSAKAAGAATEVLDYLEHERIVSVDISAGQRRYTLVHDYLIGAIDSATSDVATKTERADQLLRIYLRSAEADPGTSIPLGRLRFIARSSSPGLRQSSQAVALIQASRRRLLRIAVVSVVAIIAVPVVTLLVLSTVEWRSALISQHNAESTDAVSVGALAPFIVTQSNTRLSFWNPSDGAHLQAVDGVDVQRLSMWYLAIWPPGKPTLSFIDLRSRSVVESPFTAPTGAQALTSWSVVGEHIVDVRPAGDGAEVSLWRIKDKRVVSRFVSACRNKTQDGQVYSIRSLYASDSGDSVLLQCADGLRLERSATASTPMLDKSLGFHYVINLFGRYAALLSAGMDPLARVVSVLDLETAEVFGTHPMPGTSPVGHYFAVDGSRMFLWQAPISNLSQGPVMSKMVPLKSAAAPSDSPPDVKVVVNDRSTPVVLWPANEGMMVLSDRRSVLFQRHVTGLRADSVVAVKLHPVSNAMLVIHQTPSETTAELWTPGSGPSTQLGRAMRWATNDFTVEGDAVVVFTDASTMAVYDVEDGKFLFSLKEPIGSLVSYDRACGRLHVWTGDGRVVRYTRGREIPYLGFWPSASCGN